MRLLYLSADPGVPVFGHKGASVHLREMVAALAAAGAEVVLASPRLEPGRDMLDPRVQLVEIPAVLPAAYAEGASLRSAIAAQQAALLRAAREQAVDGIYERYSLFSAAGVRGAAALGVPHVLEVNAPLRDEARRFRTLPYPEIAAEIESEVYEATGRIFAVSRTLGGLLAADGARPEKIEIVPNAVDAARFRPSQRAGGPFTIGFAGSLKPWHGVDVLVTAFRNARRRVPELRVEVVGDGPLGGALDDAGLPPTSFVRHGALPHDETIDVMCTWDVGVAPYPPMEHFYFSPLKVLEYMAAGLCPVVSDVGEMRALLDAERGVLVPAGDPVALSAGLVELARDRGRATAIGRRARAHVLESSSWRENARRALAALGASFSEVAA
jgi:glycosyltransferase involved in cell wall biosynthesis